MIELVTEGLKGLLPRETDLAVHGFAFEGSEARKRLQQQAKQRRFAGGQAIIRDVEFLQVLVAVSCLARLARLRRHATQ